MSRNEARAQSRARLSLVRSIRFLTADYAQTATHEAPEVFESIVLAAFRAATE